MRQRTLLVMAGVVVVLGVAFFLTSRPRPAAPQKPRPYVWLVDMEDLQTMAISLPREGMREAWVKHADKYWYFDRPAGPRVDMQRWGGGVPLLLSGPGANRLITESVTEAQVRIYGLADPRMRIHLTLADGKAIDIDVGDATPDGSASYIRLAGAKDVYTVDATWCDVLERLVRDPPYPPAGQ